MIIPIQRENIPYRFEVELDDVFEFELHYNSEHDFFTVDLHKEGEVLIFGEKVVYGVPLFINYSDERFPQVTIIPTDKAGNEDRVTYDNLGHTVFLFVGDPNE
ncbi:hypothetical protein M3689_05565 [Alkalihalophilus marmarensis]|uniref:phage baseplate plug family protein n=1 Tax=Alkalihalophilus marmarensis TaxID=521377 RepID=UPI00203BD901|nr:hypothetical protein [Alkalihalophilus marmarensis]MCM3488774.1 hypothetical protein [Alkalihalophilus marmarensis]